ncbi:response regulator [Myxococcota bacterium]|nr:response regulator [Myxococcota bacterium]
MSEQSKALIDGISAAKVGDYEKARVLLLEALEGGRNEELIQLWLAHVSENTTDKISYLRQVIRLNPQNDQASRTLAAVLVQEAGSLLRNRKRDLARQYLVDASHLQPSSELVWFYLASVTQDLEEKRSSLEKVLKIAPGHEKAVAMLAALSAAPVAKPVPVSAENRQGGGMVLLVDDSPTIQKLVEVTLKRKGYEVILAGSAMAAMAELEKATVHLILLDVTMPQIDGFQLLKILKKREATKDIPVLMLTGKDGFVNRLRGKSGGALEYLTKPIKPAELTAAVGKYIS